MNQVLPVAMPLHGNPTQSPHFRVTIKASQGKELAAVDPRATRALVSLMDMHAVMGGAASHYGGPAAFAELISAVHAYMYWQASEKQKAWHELFHFVNDAGHCENGIYALKANYGLAGLDFNALKKFRSIESPLSGHGEYHLFPEGIFLSNGPLGSGFPQSQGLAMAEKLAGTNRLTFTAISDGACMEGEAREAMASIPGLASKGLLSGYVLLISDNNTKLSGRIDQESFSMAPTFKALETLGWAVEHVELGNDLQSCFDAIVRGAEKAALNPNIPVAIHARTVKGIGTRKTAESSSGGHGFPLKSAKELQAFIDEIYADKGSQAETPAEFREWVAEAIERETDLTANVVKPTVKEEKIQIGISSAMMRARKAGFPVVSITSDLPGSTGVAGFRKEFPKDSFDVGVAEANMISVGAGFSKCGYIPVVDTFAQFGVTKGALPFTMASLSGAPVIGVLSHTGFQDAADGASHQALTWLGMSMGIPNVRVVALSCSQEADALMFAAIEEFAQLRRAGKTPPTTLFFLGRENFPQTYGYSKYQLGKAQILADNLQVQAKKICLLPVGSMVPQALAAHAVLAEKGIGSIVIHPSTLNHPDLMTIKAGIGRCGGRYIVIEDHQWIGGFGNLLAAELCTQGQTLGVRGEFGRSSYTSQELYQLHCLDSEAIIKSALSFQYG